MIKLMKIKIYKSPLRFNNFPLIYSNFQLNHTNFDLSYNNYPSRSNNIFLDYLLKTYYKTASLTSHSCLGVSQICSLSPESQENCFRIGQHLGIAFQLQDDIMDYTLSKEQLGKEGLQDLREGHLTAPVLMVVKSMQKGKEIGGILYFILLIFMDFYVVVKEIK